MSSGCIDAAKFTQTSDVDAGSFDIEWVQLGCSTQDELEPLTTTMTFSDIFETADPSEDATCPEGFTSINQGYSYHECLKLKVRFLLYA
jgi:uncharacterized protein